MLERLNAYIENQVRTILFSTGVLPSPHGLLTCTAAGTAVGAVETLGTLLGFLKVQVTLMAETLIVCECVVRKLLYIEDMYRTEPPCSMHLP